MGIQYQRITLKHTFEELVVGSTEYPYQQAEVLYIKFIVYDEVFTDEKMTTWKNQPVKFLTVQPQDVLKREYEWSQEAEDELIGAADEAREMDAMRREMYKKAAEEELARRSALIKPPDEESAVSGEMFG